MKRYSEYKDSGVKWIGEIPGHWKSVPFRRIAKVQCNLVHPFENLEMLQISPDSIEKDSGKIIKIKTVAEANIDSDNHRFYKGQILYSKIRPLLNKVTIAPEDGLCSADMYPISTEEKTEFIKYYMLSKAFLSSVKNIVADRVKMPKINQDELKETRFVIPPLPEQEAIVTYLDSKVAKIDEYISIAEKKIAALEELKQTIIAEAVTRGIHKDVPMKDSGVKWIGMIPEHWKIEPFGRHFSYGKGLPITKADLTTEGVAVISYGQIHSKRNIGTTMDDSLVRYVNHKYLGTSPQCLLNKNDFVFADTSEDIEGCGNFAFNDRNESIFAGYHTIIVRPKDILQPKYYAYLFQSKKWKSQVQTLVNGVKIFSISRGILKKASLLIPTYAEQQEIVSYLDSKVASINQLCQAERSQIEKLKEYKQRLISDVVTGKVKVMND